MKTLTTFTLSILPFIVFSQILDTAAFIVRIDNLVKTARTLTDQKQYESAFETIQTAEDSASHWFGNHHPAYASCIFNHGRVFQFQGNSAKGIQYYRMAQTIWESNQEATSYPEYTSCLLNLANIYSKQGQPEEAEPLYLRVKFIREISPGRNHPGYARLLVNLGNLYVDMARFEDAEALFQEAKALRAANDGHQSREYANTLNSLGYFYYETGQYIAAETILLEVKDIYEAILGKNDAEYARVLNNLANVYTQLGLYGEAEPLLLEALQTWANASGKKDPLYSTWLANLAHLYYKNDDYQKSEAYYLQAKAMQEESLEKNHPDYLFTLNNLAVLYQETNRLNEAERLLTEVKAARYQTFGDHHPQYGASCLNLGRLYIAMKRYAEAEVFLEKSKNIIEASAGKQHQFYHNVLESQVNLLFATGRNQAAWPVLEEYLHLRHTQLFQASKYLSGQQLLAYIQHFERDLDFVINFGVLCAPDSYALGAIIFDNLLFYKGLLLSKADNLKRFAAEKPEFAGQYRLYLACHRRLAREYAKPLAERRDVAELETRAALLEKELSRNLSAFNEAWRQIKWQDIHAALRADEAAIEFVHYRHENPKLTDNVRYAAIILRAGSSPTWVPLADVGQLNALPGMKQPGQPLQVNQLYSSGTLYDIIWKPLDNQLAGARRLYYSPSGLLHFLALDAVMPPEKGLSLHRLASSRQLIEDRPASASSTGYAAVYGAIRFDMDSLAMAQANQSLEYETSLPTSVGRAAHNSPGSGGVPWPTLPFSDVEAQNVATLLIEAGMQVAVRQGFAATEESVIALCKKNTPPKVLHFSTHGFSFPDPEPVEKARRRVADSKEPVFKRSEHPMMRSGLILAGANRVWTGGKPIQGLEDGILTAYEISQLNLEGTELVVLSACETGLGKIEGNEGIYGLQRAFKIAGAKYLLMSLWQVPDFQAEAFMNAFYREWLQGKKSIPDAFKNAQLQLKTRYPEPFYWAAFILLE